MAKISAGEDFGQAVASPLRLNEAAVPRAAFGVTDALRQQGQRMQAEELRVAREREMAQDAADRARATSRLGIMRDKLQDLSRDIDGEIQAGTVPKDKAPDVWRERSQVVLSGGLQDVPEAHRALVQENLQAWTERLTSVVGDSVKRRNQSDTLTDLNATLEHLGREGINDYDAARLKAAQALDTLGPAAGLRPDQIGKAKQAWVEQTSYTRAFTAVNAAKRDNQALGVVEQAINGNADLDPQRKASLLAQVDGYRASNEAAAIRRAQQAEIAASRRSREADQAWGVLSGWAMAGKAADPEANAALLAKLEGTPYAAAYRQLAAEIPQRTALSMLPVETQQAQLDALKAQSLKGTSKPVEDEIQRREKVLSDARKDYAADPLRAGAERGVIDQLRPIDLSSMDGMTQALAQRVDQAMTVATRAGRMVSPLLPEEASRVADLFAALGPSQRAARIAQMAAVMPAGMASAIADQIGQKDRTLALQFAAGAARTTEGRTVAELIGRGAQAIKDKGIKEDTGAEIGLRASLAKEFGTVLQGRDREDVLDAARLIYLGKQANGETVSYGGALKLALGGDIVEHNGTRIPVVPGVDESRLTKTLAAYPRAAIDSQAPDGQVYVGGRALPVDQFLAALPSATLEPASPGVYFVRSGGSRVQNAQRRAIRVEVR